MAKNMGYKAQATMDDVADVLPLRIDQISSDLGQSLETIVVNTEILLDHSSNIIEKRLLQMVLDAALEMEDKITVFHELGASIGPSNCCLD